MAPTSRPSALIANLDGDLGSVHRRRAACALLVAIALFAGSAVTAQERNRRLFPPEFLSLLEAPDRDQWQKPDQIMDALGVAEGMTVADLGAGSGWFSIRLAHRVGPNGLVYAEDIQREMIEAVSRRIDRERLPNVVTVLGTESDPRLPSPVDAVLIVDAYHEMEDPVALLKNVVRYLKPQGRVGVVDFLPGGGGPGPAPEERVDPEAVIRSAKAAGLQLIDRETVPPFLFVLVFGKAGARGTP